jgi:hypothetical protein
MSRVTPRAGGVSPRPGLSPLFAKIKSHFILIISNSHILTGEIGVLQNTNELFKELFILYHRKRKLLSIFCIELSLGMH